MKERIGGGRSKTDIRNSEGGEGRKRKLKMERDWGWGGGGVLRKGHEGKGEKEEEKYGGGW